MTLQKIDPNAFRREGVHPDIGKRWQDICNLPVEELADADLVHLVNGGVGLEHFVPLILARIETIPQIFRNQEGEVMVAAVITVSAQYWIDHSPSKQVVSRIVMRLNQEMAQYEYFTLDEVSRRDWLYRIVGPR